MNDLKVLRWTDAFGVAAGISMMSVKREAVAPTPVYGG